jgi:hypothetical protein
MFGRAIDIDPKCSVALNAIVIALTALGKTDEAIIWKRRAVVVLDQQLQGKI